MSKESLARAERLETKSLEEYIADQLKENKTNKKSRFFRTEEEARVFQQKHPGSFIYRSFRTSAARKKEYTGWLVQIHEEVTFDAAKKRFERKDALARKTARSCR